MWAPAVLPRTGAIAWVVVAVMAGGCGRFSFASHDPADGAVSGDSGGGDGGDASRDAGPSVACASAAICEGFEGATLPAPWMGDSMVSVDSVHAHTGTRAVHVHSPAFGANTGSYQALFESQTVSANINPFWVRGWFWLSALPAFDNALELVTAQLPSGAGDYVFVHADSTKVYSQYDSQIMSTSTLVPAGAWFCLVWKVTRNTGTSGALELSGDVNVSLANTKTDSATSPMSIVTLGLGYSASNNPVPQASQDLWVDDVIVSASAVTCAD